MKSAYVFGAVLLLLCACNRGERVETSATTAPLLIEKRGVVMPLRDARANIAFTPLIPNGELLAVAVIPPLGGNDHRATHGIAMEYDSGGLRMLLSQWPRASYTIGVAGNDVTHRPCVPLVLTGSASGSVLWTTRNGLVMTLQPDGAFSAPRTATEVRRLIAASRCSGATTPLRGSRPRSQRSAPLHRRSTF